MLILSFVEWAGAFQRPQHMAHGFARRGWTVRYVSPGYVHRRAERVSSGVETPPGLVAIEPPALPGARRSRLIGRANEWSVLRAARAAAPVAGGRPAPFDVVVFNDPRWARVASRVPARLRIFDAMDDLSAYAPDPEWAARTEAEALAVADRVWTGTAAMADRLSERRPGEVRFVPCGADGERFANPEPAEVARARAEIDEAFARAAGRASAGVAPPSSSPPAPAPPLAGYFGALNERIDPDAIAGLLDAGWRVLLVGPESSGLPPLPADPRLLRVGPRPYASLPAYLAVMDLAIVPYRTDGPNRFLYPVKALEYLAGGVPTLSTPLPDVRRFLSDFLRIEEGRDAWRRLAESLRDADAGTPLRAEMRARTERGRAYALSRSWDAMVAEMAAELAAGGAPDPAVVPS